MTTSDLLFTGVNGYVLAINKLDGSELWRTKLGSGFLGISGDTFVTVLVEGERVYAHTCGRLFCLDASTGEHLWTNPLTGLGGDIASLAVLGASAPDVAALTKQRRQSGSDVAIGGG